RLPREKFSFLRTIIGPSCARLLGAEVVDMNLFGLLMACRDSRLPLFCWRVVSDRADDQASEDFRKFVGSYDGAGGKSIAKIIDALPADPNSPAAYPNINRVLADPTGS